MSATEIVSLAISIVTAGLMIPSYFSMKSVIKNYKLQPLKTEEDISSGFMETAVAANKLANELQVQMKEVVKDNITLKLQAKKFEIADERKTNIISDLRAQIRKLKLKIIRLEKEIIKLQEGAAK